MNKKRVAETISVFDFFKMFPNEKEARKFIESKLWENGVKCPHCEGDSIAERQSRQGYRCKKCRKDFTIKTGTIFENSNLPLVKWLYAMYLIQTSRKGISSLQLSKELGITQKSAWFIGHRIREASTQSGAALSGIVEMDETYIGGKERNKHKNKRVKGTQGRSTKTKAVIVGTKERGGRVRAKHVNSVNYRKIQDIIDKNILPRSLLSTDEARFYESVKGYDIVRVNHSVSEFVNGMASTNGIESV